MLARLSRTLVNAIERSVTIHSPQAKVSDWVAEVFGGTSDSDFFQEDAFASTLVTRAIKVLSEPMASMSVGVFERKSNGDIIKVTDHPYNYLLNVEPSSFYSSYVMRDAQVHHVCVTGNSFNQKITNRAGQVQEIVMIDPSALKGVRVDNRRGVWYDFEELGEIKGEDLIHFPGPSYNGFLGRNFIEDFRDTLILDKASRNYAKNFYENGAFVSGILSVQGELTPDGYARVSNSWQKAYGGSGNAGKTMVLEQGGKFEPVRLSPEDAGWLGTRKNLAEDVARIFGVPMHMLMQLDRSTFNNIEHQSLEFVKYTLTPWVRRFEDELNRKLFKRESKLFVRYDMNELLRGDLKSTVEFVTRLQTFGDLNINEVRRNWLQMPGIGDDGDKYLVQGNNMVPIDQLEEFLNSRGNANRQDIQDEPTDQEGTGEQPQD